MFNLGAGSTVQTLPTVDDLHTLEFVIPEPGTWLLLGLGLAGLGALQSKLVPMVVGRR